MGYTAKDLASNLVYTLARITWDNADDSAL